MHRAYPSTLVSSLSDHTLLVQGIPIVAGSAHDATAIAWERVFIHATAALHDRDDIDTKIASIDVSAASGWDE